MLFVEPPEVFAARLASQASPPKPGFSSPGMKLWEHIQAPLSYEDGWDEAIHLEVLSRPGELVRIVSLASKLRKRVRHRNKTHREEIKLQILKRIGVLIRSGLLRRVRRVFVVAA